MICAATVRQQGWSLSAPARITSQQPSCCRLSVQCHLHLAKANPNGCTTLKWNRWRDVGQAGSLRGGWLPPLSAAIAAVGRLTIGRSLPSCPTGAPPAWRTTYAQMQALLLMNRFDVHFQVAHPTRIDIRRGFDWYAEEGDSDANLNRVCRDR